METVPSWDSLLQWDTTAASPWEDWPLRPRSRRLLPRVMAAYQKAAWDQSASTAASKGQ